MAQQGLCGENLAFKKKFSKEIGALLLVLLSNMVWFEVLINTDTSVFEFYRYIISIREISDKKYY